MFVDDFETRPILKMCAIMCHNKCHRLYFIATIILTYDLESQAAWKTQGHGYKVISITVISNFVVKVWSYLTKEKLF